MPIPKPKPKESKNDFISRFMGNETMKKEYPNEKQRLGVAYSQWGKKKKLSKELSDLMFGQKDGSQSGKKAGGRRRNKTDDCRNPKVKKKRK